MAMSMALEEEAGGTVLDWSAFPHLFDLILSSCCWSSLLAFRTTSQEIRERIDTELGKHLVFGPCGNLQYGMSVVATNGHQHPAFAVWSSEWNEGLEDDDSDDGMDTHSDILPFPIADPSHSLLIASLAQSFDLAEAVPYRTFSRFLELVPTKPKVVRCLRNDSQILPRSLSTQTRVVFSYRQRPSPTTQTNAGPFAHGGDWRFRTEPFAILSDVPNSVTKFVSHLSIDLTDINLPASWIHSWSFPDEPPLPEVANNREVVLIVNPACRQQAADIARHDTEQPAVAAGPLRHLFFCMWHSIRYARITLVGFLDLPPQVFPDLSTTTEDLRQYLLDACASYVRHRTDTDDTRPTSDDIHRTLSDKLRILTTEEYRRSLDPEQFALETLEDTRDIPLRFRR